MAKAECDRTKMTMNCLAKPTQRTGEPEAPSRAWENLQELRWVLKDTTGMGTAATGQENDWIWKAGW